MKCINKRFVRVCSLLLVCSLCTISGTGCGENRLEDAFEADLPGIGIQTSEESSKIPYFASDLCVTDTDVQDIEADTEDALAACFFNLNEKKFLYAKNIHERMYPASTTKIMTLLVTLEHADLDEIVEVSARAASMPDVQLHIREGERYRLQDLCYSLMLESHNDSAVAIAEHVGGTVEGFAAMMNQKAKHLGCYHTYFITPNGLDEEDEHGKHSTTARDLARIMRCCIKNETFLSITREPSWTFTDVDGSRSFTVQNKNAFLQMMEGALSGKTGFTGTAGYCYVGALQREDKTLIVALLACGWPNNKTYKWSDTRKLMNYGLEQFKKIDLLQIEPDEAELAPIEVRDGQGGKIGETVYLKLVVRNYAGEESILAPLSSEVTLKYEIADRLYAPVKSGDYIGKIRYMLGEETLAERCVVAGETIGKIDYPWCLGQVLRLLWIE